MAWETYCTFDVYGNPKGQPRPRAFFRGGKAGVYDSGTAEGWKGQIALAAREYLPRIPFDEPLKLSVCFFFQRPKRLLARSSPEGSIPHTAKPDVDNAIKAVMDCLTQLGMWRDDAQVVSVYAEKVYIAKGQRSGALIQVFRFK